MSSAPLTTTSYAVLGLVSYLGEATPYQLKQVAQISIFHFWSIPHTQLYTECARLSEAGFLVEQREETGRRRRIYRLSEAGSEALALWREDPATDMYELRDPGLVKLFCGGDPDSLAGVQLERHQQRLELYETLKEQEEMPEPMRLALDAGIGHEQEYVRFWSRLRTPDAEE